MRYYFEAGDGTRVEGWEAIVPIILREPSGRLTCIGTGFFIHAHGVVATAAHVVAEALKDDGTPVAELLVLQFVPPSRFLLRGVAKGTRHTRADVAILGLISVTDPATKGPVRNRVMAMTTDIPPDGTEIFSWAFPKSAHIEANSKGSIAIVPRLYRGLLVQEHRNGRDQVMLPGPCYETTLGIEGGASGGPVFTESGAAFAINSTGMDGTDIAYVSHVQSLGGLPLQGYRGADGIVRDNVTIKELIDRGEVLVASGGPSRKPSTTEPGTPT